MSAIENPRLKRRILACGKESLYLEYYLGRSEKPKTDLSGNQLYYTSGKMKGRPVYAVRHSRRQENLHLYLVIHPRTPEDRERNRETLALARRICFERGQELLEDREGYRLRPARRTVEFIEFFQSCVDGYTMKDKRNMVLALNKFKAFLELRHPEFCRRRSGGESCYSLAPCMLSREMVREFADYLAATGRNSGPSGTFRRFKHVVARMVSEGHISRNPCAEVRMAGARKVLTKEVLTAGEIRRLAATHYRGENPEIRRAFLFCVYTGMRFCDVKELRRSDIDAQKRTLSFEQSKTKGRSVCSRVEMPLREEILHLALPEDKRGWSPAEGDSVFRLPSHTMCLKALRRWTARAGISKHITWHCARHTFATQLIANGADVVTTASLLGHSGLEYVRIYAHALEDNKRRAVDSLPALEI